MLSEFFMVAQCDYASSMRLPYCLSSRATTCKGTLNATKVQYKLRVASGLNLRWYISMDWKKIVSMEYGKTLMVGRYSLLFKRIFWINSENLG